jgi:hypothetical protein
VVWAVCKGSLVNKVILVPTALAISGVAHSLVTPLLMVGGAYLCFEGVEKLAHKFLAHGDEGHAHEAELLHALKDPEANLLALEKDKIKGAIRTDFILSAEIIAITLGTVQNSPLLTQFLVLAGMSRELNVLHNDLYCLGTRVVIESMPRGQLTVLGNGRFRYSGGVVTQPNDAFRYHLEYGRFRSASTTVLITTVQPCVSSVPPSLFYNLDVNNGDLLDFRNLNTQTLRICQHTDIRFLNINVGMTGVHGEFARGDVIAVRDTQGLEIARGLANYSSAEARLICRKASSDFEKLLGYTGEPEMVHRTNLVLSR